MGRRSLLLGLEYKWVVILFVLTYINVSIRGVNSRSKYLQEIRKRIENNKRHEVKSIQSEDGDIIDCIDIYKQPAFNHPALRNHKIQMTPTYDPTMETDTLINRSTRKEEPSIIRTYQLWRRNGSCPTGTIPIRRTRKKDLQKLKSTENYGRKGLSLPYQLKRTNDNGEPYHLQMNHSQALLITAGYNYNGAKADIKVWTPFVEHDDEYSTSRIALKSGPYNDYESIESGWVVNPSLYGDRETRMYTYWTVDGLKTTGCFDLTCPGFVQTSNEIALGGVIRSNTVPGDLPWIMTLYIVKDIITQNWWLQYQENIFIGYWPAEIFGTLSVTAETVQWGGEVYSSRLGHPGHTRTAMGNGNLADYTDEDCGWTKRMRIRDNSMVLKYPDWVYAYTDDYLCYTVFLHWEYVEDPGFYFGGPNMAWLCN